jgi:crossover junction endodeoxyribonuclease RuvC
MNSSGCVLGIDPGSLHTGYGVVKFENQRFVAVDYGTIRMTGDLSLPERLGLIYRSLETIIARTNPISAAVEDVFFAHNARSALQLGQARGAAIVAAVNAGIPVFSYSALEVKQSVVGYGRATKQQVNAMVKRLLAIREALDHHASDARALAICHLNSMRMKMLELRP